MTPYRYNFSNVFPIIYIAISKSLSIFNERKNTWRKKGCVNPECGRQEIWTSQ